MFQYFARLVLEAWTAAGKEKLVTTFAPHMFMMTSSTSGTTAAAH
jgi:hypothetical protein